MTRQAKRKGAKKKRSQKEKPNRYVSRYTHGLQSQVHTKKDCAAHNYHFWCVDETGKIVDETPPELPDLNENKIYIEWSTGEQQKQKKYCNHHIKGEIPADQMEETLEMIYENSMYVMKKCYRNSRAVAHCNPTYRLVCGSVGFKVDETSHFNVISLDYGY